VCTGEGTEGRIAVCSLRSVSLTFLRPVSMYCLVLSISCVSRKHTMPPKPANSQKHSVPHLFVHSGYSPRRGAGYRFMVCIPLSFHGLHSIKKGVFFF